MTISGENANNLTAPANIIKTNTNNLTAPANTVTAPANTFTTPAAPAAPENENSAIIENADNANAAAAGIPAEDTAVIAEQREMINTLLEHTKSLQNQINTLMRSGASVTDGTAKHEEPAEAPEDYVSFADLGREMGERRYENKNLEGGKYER